MNNIQLPEQILNTMHFVVAATTKKYYKNGVELEKGAIITERRILKMRSLYETFCEFWSVYPDCFVDLITPSDSKFSLKFFQRLFLRELLRKGRVLTIASRAAGKSFICILALILICIFRPKSHVFQCAPGKGQGAKIATQKIKQLFDLLPLLKNEIIGEGNFGADYVRLSFKNGSFLDIMSPINSTRGNRATAGIIDEFRDHSSDDINEIILPLLNIDRPMCNQELNKKEPQQCQFWISSASDKNTFCYDKTIEMLESAIINPNKNFIMGFDYRVPIVAGLLSKDFLNELKISQTFSEAGFAKEYMSRFVGNSDESWFDYEKFLAHRRIVNPETREIVRDGIESFYILSVDIARKGCQSVCVVLKVFPRKDSPWKINVVNLFILGKTQNEKDFDHQVLELKRLIKIFNPREVVIDINGIGFPFGDAMVKETFDPLTGEILPAYGFHNKYEDDFTQQRGCQRILYGIKANGQLNSDIHSTLYSKIYAGLVNFLISEQDAKTKLMSTKAGQKMKPEAKVARLMPHELTTILINEILNLRLKPTGNNNQITVEPINSRMGKDKFSALEYGIWRISELENEVLSRRRNRGLGGKRKLTFFKTRR